MSKVWDVKAPTSPILMTSMPDTQPRLYAMALYKPQGEIVSYRIKIRARSVQIHVFVPGQYDQYTIELIDD